MSNENTKILFDSRRMEADDNGKVVVALKWVVGAHNDVLCAAR